MGETVIKIIAAALLIGSGYFFGKSMHKKFAEKKVVLELLIESILFLKSKICQEAYTLPEALSATVQKFCEYPDSLYERTAYYMVSEGLNAETAWGQACDTFFEKSFIGEEDMSVIKNAGKLLGCGDRHMQQENLDGLTENLKKALKEADIKEKRDGALYIKIGLAAGCIFAIILW